MSTTADYRRLLRLEPEALRCPHEAFRALREASPACWLEELGVFAVTRFAEVEHVLRNPELFRSDLPTGPGAGAMAVRIQQVVRDSPEMQELLASGYGRGGPVLLNANPPDHTRQRALVARAFGARRVKSMRADIESVAEALVDAFVDDGRVELVRQFAVPLPLTVVADALGVARDDLATFKRWSDDSVRAIGNDALTDEAIEGMIRSQVEFGHYFARRIEERRAAPQDDLITDVVSARLDGTEPLTLSEMLSMFQQFLVAGNETTTKLITGAVRLLVEQPEVQAAVRADRSLVGPLVEEVLRLEAPVQGLYRQAAQDTELGGVAIAAGSHLWLLYASANRDEATFADADRLDLGRANARSHLAFGGGPHFCVGALLARTEGQVALDTLLDRLDELAFAPENTWEFEPSYVLHGQRELHLAFAKRR